MVLIIRGYQEYHNNKRVLTAQEECHMTAICSAHQRTYKKIADELRRKTPVYDPTSLPHELGFVFTE